MGRKVTTDDIFLPVLKKFKERLQSFSPTLKTMPAHHRIITINVFLVSIPLLLPL